MGATEPAAKRFAPVGVDKWNLLLDALRADPGNLSRAARVAGVDRATARKFWERGKASEPWGKVPMREIIANEQAVAAARQGDRQKAIAALTRPTLGEAEAARDEAIEVRRQELGMIATARASALAGLTAFSRIAGATMHLAVRYEQLILQAIANPQPSLDAKGVLDLITAGALAGQRITVQAERALEFQRRYGGDPMRPGVPGEGDEERIMTTDDVQRALENASVIHERMRNLNLRVITGGAVGDVPEPPPAPTEPATPPPAPTDVPEVP